MRNQISIYILSLIFLMACEPDQDISRELGPLPSAPEFSLNVDPNNPNQIIVEITSPDFFDLIWDLPGGTPNRSEAAKDTIFYQKAGDYTITLHAASQGGNGTAINTKVVNIAQDAQLDCNETLKQLTNNCTSKCWRLSEEPGSIQVGPTPLSSEWYNSPGLDPSQVDDLWCFDAEKSVFEYNNGGGTFSVCAGYIEVPDYNIPPNVSFTFTPSSSGNSEFQITLDDGSWMGVEDSGFTYEIASISEDTMVMLAPIRPCDGSASPGWFTLTFIKA